VPSHHELPPIPEAISRIIGAAVMGESPGSVTREIEAIVKGWLCEPGIDHFEIEGRLSTLRDELANGIEAGKKPLPAFAYRKPIVVEKMRALREGLVTARETVCRLRAQSLV
jgi:hypothetical protein